MFAKKIVNKTCPLITKSFRKVCGIKRTVKIIRVLISVDSMSLPFISEIYECRKFTISTVVFGPEVVFIQNLEDKKDVE